jgi:hypothetical protein
MKKRLLSLLLLLTVLTTFLPTTNVKAAESLAKPTVSIETTKSNNPKLSWNEVSDADGYRVFRKTSTDKKYVKVTTTSKLTYTDSKWKATAGTTVKYYVKAYYKDDNGKTVWSKQSTVKKWTVPSKKVEVGDAGKIAPDNKNSKNDTYYILNTHTMKYHLPTCKDVPKIKKENYAKSTDSKKELESKGYAGCKHCNP